MIMVLFGTNPYNFERLATAIDKLAIRVPGPVIAQLGHTKCRLDNVTCYDFLAQNELYRLIDEADMVISQGGFGSISTCLARKKKIVAVPRKRELNECRDDGDGQAELVRELERQGKLIGVYDIADLEDAVSKVHTLNIKESPSNQIPAMVADFVNSVIGEQQ